MRTMIIRHVFLYLCISLFANGCVGKEEFAFYGESAYESSGGAEISKIVARAIAREKLLDRMGHLVKTDTALRQHHLTPAQIAAISAGCANTEILQEVCSRTGCYVKIALTANVVKIIRVFERLCQEHGSVESLVRVREYVREVLRKVEEYDGKKSPKKRKNVREYESLIHSLRAVECFEKGIFAMWVKKNTELALEELSNAILYDPTLTEAYYYRGILFLQKQDLPLALRDFENVLTCAPDHVRAHFSRGSTLTQIGRYEEAIAHLSAVITLDPRDERAYFRRCVARIRIGDYYEALRDCDMALDTILLKEFPSQVFHEREHYVTRDLTTERTGKKTDRWDIK